MGLHAGDRVLDIGAGKCGWLAATLRAFPGTSGVGVEPASLFADEAHERHAQLIQEGRLRVVRSTARDYLGTLQGDTFAGALCVGSTHALEGYTGTLDVLKDITKPGGVIVVAEGYWKKKPCAEYLSVLGGDEAELTTHTGNIERAVARGWTPRLACTVTDDEWDEYEWGYSRGIEDFVRANPGDPDAAAMLLKSRTWRDGYVKWGRETLGFGVYVFQR